MKTTYIKNTLYLLALFIPAFIACDKDEDDVTGQPEIVSRDIIASEGGKLTTTGEISLVIPANSLPEDVNVSVGISGHEPTTIANEDLIIIGTPFTVSIPCDTLFKPVKIIVPKPSDMTPDNTSVFAFNGNSYFPFFYEFNGNKAEISLDIINWENNRKKFASPLIILFLRQKQTPDQVMMGLNEVSVSNNELVYSDIPPVNPNSTILLMIHGWIGSPQTWDEFVPKIQSDQDLGYTNYLTFGYNSSLSIDDNGKLLSDLIKANANGAKIDIVAHSMGGLVSRAAIENHGCHQHINSLITLGTPHLGSNLAVTRYIIGYYVGLSELWHLFSYNANSQGYKDLNTFSSFLTQLNQNPTSSVPYHTIACINNPDKWPLSKTALLPGPDDGIVTVNSAKTVAGASQPLQDVTIDIGNAHTIMTRNDDIFDQILVYLSHSESTTYNIEFAADIPVALIGAGVTSTVVNNNIYIFGGHSGSEPFSNKAYKYNTSTDSWTDLGNILPYGTANSTNNVAVHNSSLFYITPSLGPYSYNGWGQNKEILEYDVNNNSIDIKAAYPVNSWNISPIAHNNIIYLFGRHTGSDHKDIFRYQPSTNELVNLGQILPYISSLPLAVKGNTDDIYLFGGRTYKRSLVVFDPTNETIKYNEENFLPFELTGGAAWSDGSVIFVIEPATGKVYEYDSNDHSFNESSFQIFENNTLYRPLVSKDESTGVVYLISGQEGDNLVNTVRKLIPIN